jgi:hypothetical protein
VSELLLGGQELRFYQWDGDVNELLDKVYGRVCQELGSAGGLLGKTAPSAA